MSYTYQSCYKVTVPPLDFYHSSRRTGVRLREGCPPLNELKEFDILYLPAQLRAEYLEAEAERMQQPLPKAPGWKENPQHALDETIARQTRLLNANAVRGSDADLNGSLASKTRYALRNEFYAVRGADGNIVHSVRYQRGARLARRGSLDRAVAATGVGGSTDGARDETPVPEPIGGLPSWMRIDPPNVSLPRSTTHATYRHIPEDSFILDREAFHGPELLPPPTPVVDSTGRIRPLSQQSRNQVVKRIPLTSNEQPSIFFRIPGRLAHPEFWRKSKLLRGERESERKLESARGRSMQLAASTTGQQQPPLSARPSSIPARPPPSSSPPAHKAHLAGSQTERIYRPRPENAQAQPSKFQQHMEQARQRWREQGLIPEEEY